MSSQDGADSVVTQAPFLRRLAVYLGERFPPLKHGLLIAAFSASALCLAILARGGETWPPPHALTVAFTVVFALFFQLRVADEHKDYEDDLRYRPERAVPRGLVSLAELRRLGAAAAVLQVALAATLGLTPVLALLLTWGWMGLMSVEFFVPAWLKARPVLYLLSHMVVMPLFALFAIASDVQPAGEAAPRVTALVAFLALAFANGVVLEIARKCWASEAEREGVETYSKLWGHRTAGRVVAAALATGLALAVWIAQMTASGWLVLLLVSTVSLCAVAAALRYASAATPAAASGIELAAGLVVLVHYLALGPIALAGRLWGN